MIPTLHIQLLGGFHLHVDDVPIATLDQERLQSVLAYLLLHRATPQSRQHLAFLLWPDSTEAQARSNLRNLIHRLRQALPEADRFLHVDAQTVQWRADGPWTLDVSAFEQALVQAERAGQRGDQAAAGAALQQAVAHYHGELLPGWYDDWVLLERERLRQAFLSALERLSMLLERQQDYPAAIDYAQRLLRHDPLHEVAYQHLMRLHALSGDRASAVRVYQTCVTVLERELGVEPSPATRDAYERIFDLEVAAASVERTGPPAPGQRRHNLPIALTSFIGRAHERAEVSRLLGTTRLLTLTGAGGCGKTRLATRVATELVAAYADGVWLVELAALTDAALVPQAVATTLGVREEPQHPLAATLLDALRSRDMLLVLDNCEHLIDACAQLATTLLGACPQLHILATSREALGIAGETSWLVPSLALPDIQQPPRLEELAQVEAVRLFVERALATLPTFTLAEANAAAVAHLCRRLDGIPLAIELAAARLKLLSVEQIAERLDDCIQLLTSGSRTALPRQQTLRAAIDWSYDLLTEAERALFRRLSVFAGGWTLEAAEAVCSEGDIAEDVVLEVLARLVDKSLVVVEAQQGGAVRYRLLEPIRQYAQAKLRQAGEIEAAHQHYIHFYLALAEEAEPELRGAGQGVWLKRLEIEHDNLRAALGWALESGEAELATRLSWALWRFWWVHGHLNEGREWLRKSLAHVAGDVQARARALTAAGVIALWQGDAGANALLEEALALGRSLDDRLIIAYALSALGIMRLRQDDYEASQALSEEGLALARDAGDAWLTAAILNDLGLAVLGLNNLARAVMLFEESLALRRTLNDQRGLAIVLLNLGEIAQRQGNNLRAQALYEKSLTTAETLGSKELTGEAFLLLGHLAKEKGDYPVSAQYFQRALALFRELGAKVSIVEALAGLAGLAGTHGQATAAVQLLGATAAVLESIGLVLEPATRRFYDRDVAAARAQLAEATFAITWAEGHAMTLEQAIAEAQRVTDALISRTTGATA